MIPFLILKNRKTTLNNNESQHTKETSGKYEKITALNNYHWVLFLGCRSEK